MIKKLTAVFLSALMLASVLCGCSESSQRGDFYPYNLSGYVKLGDYDKVVYSPEVAEVTEEEVEEQIKSELQKNDYCTTSEKSTAAEKGDIANIDYIGYIDGKAFSGGSASGYSLKLGSKTFIDGFEEGLIGKKAGEKVDLNLKFPDSYHAEEYAGKEVVFKVSVNRVFKETYPELTDEIVSRISKQKNVADYKKAVYDALLQNEKAQAEQNNSNKFISDVIGCCTIKKYPQKEVENYQQNLIKQYEAAAKSQGTTLENFAKSYGYELNEFEQLMEDNAKKVVEKEMIFTLIAEKEGITISQQEYNSSLKSYTEENGYTDSDEFLEAIGKDRFMGILIVDKTILKLKEKLLKK